MVKAGLFKAKLTALVAYMKNVLHSSFSNIRKYIRDILQLKVSRGYLAKLIQKVGNILAGPYEELLGALPLTSKVNVDETGHKENGDRFWTWVFRTDLFVLFKIDKSRGSKVLIEVLGKEFNGVLGCDYFSAYRKYMKGRKANERLWTVIATCALQGKSAFEFILKAVEAYFSNKASPSLIPVTS